MDLLSIRIGGLLCEVGGKSFPVHSKIASWWQIVTWLLIAFFREIQKALQDCKALYPRLELSIASACGAHVLKVLVPKTLKATIVLRMTEIDQVIIRGIQESSLLEKEESQSPSRHVVFSKITDYATSVVLHYYSATDPTAQVRGFLVSWIVFGDHWL